MPAAKAVHFHLLVLDGVYRRESEDRLQFVPVPAPSTEDLKRLVQRIAARVGRSLERSGLITRDIDNAYLAFDPGDEAPIHGLLGASITYRIATGPREGQKVFMLQTLPAESDVPRPEVAESSGFSLHAGIAAKAWQRDKVERLARYVSRPPVAIERLSLTQSGQVRDALTNWQDCQFARTKAARRAGHRDVPGEHAVSRWQHARDLRARGFCCATRRAGAQAPRPPDAPSRRIRPSKPRPGTDVPRTRAAAANECGETSTTDRQRALTWAQRLKRVFAIDIETCLQCGGRLRVIASIEAPAVIDRILAHLGREAGAVNPAHPSRAPPRPDGPDRLI